MKLSIDKTSLKNRFVLSKLVTMNLTRASHVQRLAYPRDYRLITLVKLVVVRLKVCLAYSVTNYIEWITRSVIHCDMRAQSMSTVVSNAGRAVEQPFE